MLKLLKPVDILSKGDWVQYSTGETLYTTQLVVKFTICIQFSGFLLLGERRLWPVDSYH